MTPMETAIDRVQKAGGKLVKGKWEVEGNLNLSCLNLTELPPMRKIGGYFSCDNNQLTSLAGAPKKVGGYFSCSYNQLTSLAGAPNEVGGGFYCDGNQLTSLEGAPNEVGESFSCSYNQLTSLEGAPKRVGGGFYCNGNQLTSLAGAPEKVGGNFNCHNNQLASLEGAPKEVGGGFYCYSNQLTSLKGAPKEVGGGFWCYDNPLPRGTTYKGWLAGQQAPLPPTTTPPEEEGFYWVREVDRANSPYGGPYKYSKPKIVFVSASDAATNCGQYIRNTFGKLLRLEPSQKQIDYLFLGKKLVPPEY